MKLLLLIAASLLMSPFTYAGVLRNVAPVIMLRVSTPQTVNVSDFAVNTTIINTGTQSVSLLKHPGFFKQLSNNFAIIDSENNVARYTGVQVHYSPELASRQNPDHSLLTLAPGESFIVTHNLDEVYDLGTLESGQARVQLRSTLVFYMVDAQSRAVIPSQYTVVHEQPGVELEVARGAVLPAKQTMSPSAQRPNPMAGCTSVQRLLIDTVIPFAEEYVAAANTYLQFEGANSTFYHKWFGSDVDSFVDQVITGFKNISTNNFANYTFNCGESASLCEPGVNAYVFPSQFGAVYLCDNWFSSQTVGYNSQAAILVHEASHFAQNAATLDYRYGMDACLALAEDDPAHATKNADSYQYFSVDAGSVHL